MAGGHGPDAGASDRSRGLYLQVIVAIVLGAALGALQPDLAVKLKPLGDGFVRLVKMLITPIVFSTVVVGIAGMGDLKKVGRVGVKALLYFEVVTTLALAIGLAVVNTVRPGAGLHADPARLDAHAVEGYARQATHHGSAAEFVLGLIPENAVEAFARGEILQVLLLAVLFGLALAGAGERGRPMAEWFDRFGQTLFGVVGLVMRLAPVGAFGAMAFTVGRFGLGALASLGKLMAAFYATSFLFVALVLGTIARAAGINIWALLRFLREEFLLVLGTSSSESALPGLMAKLERLGCSRAVVGLVVPTGYSFNLDGTSIYLTMAALFVAQATDVHLTLGQQLTLLGVLLLTSKGAAAVTGGGFVTLAATLSSTGSIPVAGLALLLGIDKFMSEARALTNLAGNAVATVVVARWEGEFDAAQAARVLTAPNAPAPAPDSSPAP